jgi:CRISPR/Cas system-associated exonuclease Cas4 (RecB family)
MAKNLLSKIIKKQSYDIDYSIISQKIYEGFVKVNGEGKFNTKKSFAPSQLVYGQGHCPRYWYLAFEGNYFENKNDGIQIAKMNTGTDAHNRIEAALKQTDILEWSEQTVTSDDPPISGKMDALLKIDDKLVAMELKTATDEAFNYHKQNNHATGYHIEQILIYMKILNLQYGVIVYSNKSSSEILSIPIVVEQKHVDFIEYLFDWMKQVKTAFDNKTLPERGYRKDSKVCQACPLEKVCDSREKGDIKIERRKELG